MKNAVTRDGEVRRPRSELAQIGTVAIRIRKQLRQLQSRSGPLRNSGTVTDVVKTCQTLQHLAERGQTFTAEDAIDAVDVATELSEYLSKCVDVIFAEHNQLDE